MLREVLGTKASRKRTALICLADKSLPLNLAVRGALDGRALRRRLSVLRSDARGLADCRAWLEALPPDWFGQFLETRLGREIVEGLRCQASPPCGRCAACTGVSDVGPLKRAKRVTRVAPEDVDEGEEQIEKSRWNAVRGAILDWHAAAPDACTASMLDYLRWRQIRAEERAAADRACEGPAALWLPGDLVLVKLRKDSNNFGARHFDRLRFGVAVVERNFRVCAMTLRLVATALPLEYVVARADGHDWFVLTRRRGEWWSATAYGRGTLLSPQRAGMLLPSFRVLAAELLSALSEALSTTRVGGQRDVLGVCASYLTDTSALLALARASGAVGTTSVVRNSSDDWEKGNRGGRAQPSEPPKPPALARVLLAGGNPVPLTFFQPATTRSSSIREALVPAPDLESRSHWQRARSPSDRSRARYLGLRLSHSGGRRRKPTRSTKSRTVPSSRWMSRTDIKTGLVAGIAHRIGGTLGTAPAVCRESLFFTGRANVGNCLRCGVWPASTQRVVAGFSAGWSRRGTGGRGQESVLSQSDLLPSLVGKLVPVPRTAGGWRS